MLYRGISVRDAAMMMGVPEQTVRSWLYRKKIHRTRDGRIDAESVGRWWDDERNPRLGKREPIHRAKHNPYAHPDAPSHEGCA